MNQTISTKFKKSPSFSFRGKFNQTTSTNKPQYLPSPHHYNPQKKLKNDPKVVFPKSQRKTFLDKKLQKLPGPGQYQTSRSIQMKYESTQSLKKIRTFSSRFYQSSQTKAFPGPGAYEVKKDFRKTLPTFSIAKKFKTLQQIQLQKNKFKPSPGAYDIEKNSIKSSSIISIPKSPRMKTQLTSIPGPGKYHVNQQLFSSRKSFGKRSFNSQKRQISFQIKTQSPGPGNYALQSSFEFNKRRQRGFSYQKFAPKLDASISNIPGPGQYQANNIIKFRSPASCKMAGSDKRLLQNWKKQQNPGPGKYQNTAQNYNKLNFKSRSAPKFSKAKLQTLSSIKLNNTTQKFYDANHQIVKRSSSSYSIGAQKKVSAFSRIPKLPGPGDYNPQTKIVTQSCLTAKFPQSQRSNFVLNKLKVGPGQYYNEQTNKSFSKLGTKFSKGKRALDFSKLVENNIINKPTYRVNSNNNIHINSSLSKTGNKKN